MGLVTAYDSTDITTVPSNAQFLMGYNSGHWPTYGQMVDRFPALAKAGHIKSIAVQADVDGDILDAEPGDASPDQVAGWVQRQFARGAKRPIVYSSISEFPQILADLHTRGIWREQIGIWTADYNGQEHICGPGPGGCVNASRFGFNTTADATQWTDAALGRNLDQSLCKDEFWTPAKKKPDPHYQWYLKVKIGGKEYDEQALVREYDRLRDRPLSKILPERGELRALRALCKMLANRIARVALYDEKTGRKRAHAEWGPYHRGFRYQGLIHRSQGKRVA